MALVLGLLLTGVVYFWFVYLFYYVYFLNGKTYLNAGKKEKTKNIILNW
ncbi:MAG: hypothetical protein ACOCZT_03490 [Halanaerobiales bacterium]